ncbi:MAG: deoxyribonuclease IV [Chloroflexi bacterium]|nr:deoxyribonuclease IV [Chloroflexota bacterium]
MTGEERPGSGPAGDALGGRMIGPHLPVGGALLKAADRAGAIGATALQIFSDNPTAWRRKAGPPTDLQGFRARLEGSEVVVLAVHGSYLVNLAGPDEAFWQRSVETMSADLAMAQTYAATLFNIHAGSHRGAGVDVGHRRIAAGLAMALELGAPEGRPRVVIENSAGGRDSIGSRVEELAALLEEILGAGVPARAVGFCLDTAHRWGAGYDLSDPNELDGLLATFDRLVGSEHLAMIHLNDSRSERGSRIDRHQHLGAGRIGASGLAAIVRHPRLARVPMFFETPGMDEGYEATNMARVRLLLAGEPLPELPAEALNMSSSRVVRRTPAASPPGPPPTVRALPQSAPGAVPRGYREAASRRR